MSIELKLAVAKALVTLARVASEAAEATEGCCKAQVCRGFHVDVPSEVAQVSTAGLSLVWAAADLPSNPTAK